MTPASKAPPFLNTLLRTSMRILYDFSHNQTEECKFTRETVFRTAHHLHQMPASASCSFCSTQLANVIGFASDARRDLSTISCLLFVPYLTKELRKRRVLHIVQFNIPMERTKALTNAHLRMPE